MNMPNGSSITIPVWESFLYHEVYVVIEWRDGCVYKTKPVGFCHKDRLKKEGEIYASVSTDPTGDITLGPMLD